MPAKYLHSSEDLAQTHDVPLHFLPQYLLCHQLSFHRGGGQVCSGRTAKAPCSSLQLLPWFPCWLAESSSSNTLILVIVQKLALAARGQACLPVQATRLHYPFLLCQVKLIAIFLTCILHHGFHVAGIKALFIVISWPSALSLLERASPMSFGLL